jgi:hypothetical protein
MLGTPRQWLSHRGRRPFGHIVLLIPVSEARFSGRAKQMSLTPFIGLSAQGIAFNRWLALRYCEVWQGAGQCCVEVPHDKTSELL